jgi:hypothetical protein
MKNNAKSAAISYPVIGLRPAMELDWHGVILVLSKYSTFYYSLARAFLSEARSQQRSIAG